MTQQRERAKPLSPDERRQAIIDAVIPILDPNAGPLTTKQIAEAAGIAEGTIFRVFPDKVSLFFALAEEVSSPSGSEGELQSALSNLDDLHSKVVLTVGEMMERTEKMLVVLHSLKLSMAGETIAHPKPGESRAPTFMIRASQRLITILTDVLFSPHRDELRVSPEVAATALQGLVFGLAHPGIVSTVALTPEDIASMVLDGVQRSQAESS